MIARVGQIALGALAGWLVAGWVGLPVGGAAAAALVFAPRTLPAAAAYAPALLALWTAAEADLDARSIRTFVQARPVSHDLGLVTVVVWAAAAVAVWKQSVPDRTVAAPSPRPRSRWALAVLVIAASLGALTAID